MFLGLACFGKWVFQNIEFKELLSLATKESNFIFNGKLYKQVDRVAMGSHLGPSLANAFLAYFEKIWLQNYSSDIKSRYFRCYVDNIFMFCSYQQNI